MSVSDLTKNNIEETIMQNEIVFIDFWAAWCGPCRNFAPTYEKVALKNSDIKFVKLNTDEEPEIAAEFEIKSIPTIAIFKERELIFLQSGMLTEESLTEVVQKVREINMDEVRQEIAKQKN